MVAFGCEWCRGGVAPLGRCLVVRDSSVPMFGDYGRAMLRNALELRQEAPKGPDG